MKKIILLAILGLVVGAAAFFSLGSDAKEEKAPAEKPPQEVIVMEIQPVRISNQQSLPGRVTAYRQSEVRPQVDGIVTQRMFEEGTKVEQGQQLYQIDDARYKALLNSAIADLKSAQATVKSTAAKAERYKELVKVQAISKQEYDDVVAQINAARAQVAVAQAAVDLAQVNLDYTKVYAPIAGQIGRSFVTDGTLVTANQAQPLAMITQLDPVYVDMQQSLSESGMADIQSQMVGRDSVPVRLMTGSQSSGKTYAHEGMLKFSEVTVEQTTSSIALRALFPNPDGALLPGTFVRATLDLGGSEAILVPQRSTSRGADGSLKVWVVDAQNKANPKFIVANKTYEDQWIVESGLNVGERIITEGYQKVKPDTVVNPVVQDKKEAQSEKAAEDKAATAMENVNKGADESIENASPAVQPPTDATAKDEKPSQDQKSDDKE